MKKFAFFAVIASTILLSSLAFFLFSQTTNNKKEYQQLTQQINNQPKGQTTQQRYNVRKDIYFSEGLKRKHILVICPTTELFLTSENKQSATILEKLHKVRCWMQEELFYDLGDGQEAILQPNGKYLLRPDKNKKEMIWIDPSDADQAGQIVRYFEADEATYDYNRHLFWADNTPIARYRALSHDLLPTTESIELLMKGHAKQAKFDLHGKDIAFHLQQLKATFFDPSFLPAHNDKETP